MNNGYSVEAILKATGADKFASDFEKAGKSLGGLTSSTKKAAGGVKSFMGGVGKLASAIGVTKLVSAGFSAIRSSVDGAVSRVDTLNRFPKVLEQMGATGEDADRSIARLSDGIQGLPTTLDGVASTAQRMFTILGDVDLATESTLALNNAFLASGASQADASRGLEQYTQMLSAGKVDMQSWRTLQETMPYALKETAEAFGFTGQSATNDFYDALQSGEVTMDEMNEKIIELSTETGGFAETALEASKGLATSWQNIKTAIVTGTANIIQAINEWMEDAGLGGIAENFDKVKEAVQGAFSYIVENIPVVLDGIMGLFDTIKNSTAFQTMRDAIQLVIDKGQELISTLLESEAWANFKSLMGDVAQAVLDIDFGTVISQVGEFLEKWSPLIAGIIVGIAVFKGLTFVAGMFSAISAAGGILAIVMGALSTAGTILGGVIAFLTSPITLVAIAIGAVIAIGVALWKNWDTIKEKASELGQRISEVWTSVKEWTSETWETIKTTVIEAVTNIWNSITEWFGQLPTWFSETWNSIVGTVTEWASNMIGKAIEVGTQFVENISTFFSELPYNVGFFLGEVIGSVIVWGTNMWNKAIETGTNFLTSISEFFSQLPGRVSNFLSNTWQRVVTWATNMGNKAKETGSNFINSIVTWFQQLPGRIQTWLSNAISRVTTWVSNMTSRAREAGSRFITNVINYIQQLPGRIQTWLTNAISRVITFVSNMGTKAIEAGRTFITGLTSTLSSLPGQMVSIGKNIVTGLWNGIKGMWNNMTGWFGNLATGFIDGVKSKFGVKSPSRVFRDEIGKMLVLGLGQGIERNEKEAINPMDRMLDNVIGVFDSQTSGLGATFNVTGESNISSAMNRTLDVDMPMVNGRVSHEMNNNLSTQPAYINVNIGGQNFRGFVENISSEQGRITDLEMQF